MKNACFALIGFLATAAFADLTPNTIIDNVPGDTTLSNLVAASGVLNPPWGSGGGGVDTNAVDVIANEAVKTNAVTVGLLSAVSNRYTKDETDALLSGKQADVGIVNDGHTVVMPENRTLAVQGQLYVTGSAEISGSLNAPYITVDGAEVALHADIPTVIDPAVATTTGKAADALKVKEALAEKRGITDRTFVNPGSTFPFSIEKWVVGNSNLEFVLRNPSSKRWEISTGEAYSWIDGEKTSDGWRFEFWDVLDEPELLSSWSGSDITNASLENGDVTPVIITDTLALTSEVPEPYTPPPYLRAYDEVRQCWWRGRMVNGVINWEVE